MDNKVMVAILNKVMEASLVMEEDMVHPKDMVAILKALGTDHPADMEEVTQVATEAATANLSVGKVVVVWVVWVEWLWALVLVSDKRTLFVLINLQSSSGNLLTDLSF